MSLRRVQRFKRTLVSAVTRAVVRGLGEGKKGTAAVAGPQVTGGQSFSYVENKSSGYTIGTVLATDPVAITQFRFSATGTGTSSDGFFAISAGGVLTLTVAGAASAANDFETLPNSFTPSIQAGNAANVWSPAASVTINVLDVDDTAPVVTPSQTINYVENQSSGAVIGTVAATDNVGVTGYRFTATGTSTSSDTFFSISSAGVVTMTVAGAAGSMNDYDDGVTNSAVHSVQAGDAAGNWSTGVNVTFNVTNSTADDVSMLVGMNMGPAAYYNPTSPFANILWQASLFRRTDDASDAIWNSQNQGLITGATGTMTFYATLISGDSGCPSQTFRFKNPDGNQIGFGTTSGAQDIVSFAAGAAATGGYIDVPYVSGTGLMVHVKGSTTNTGGTYLTAPHLLMPGHESSYASGDYFNAAAVSFHTGLGTKVVRVMDWEGTNVSVETDWTDRSLLSGISFRTPSGNLVPWEVCIAWANRLSADLYVNIPTRATSAYVTSLMALINSNLTGSLKIYSERGNELGWNLDGAFGGNSAWIEYHDHTRFSLTVSGSTITKTAHGHADGTEYKTWETSQALALGIDSDTAYGLGYTGYYKMARGATLYTKSTGVDTFQLWDGAGGTGNLITAPPGVTTLVAILVNEVGKTPDMNAHVGERSVADWVIADAALGAGRVKAVMPAQAANEGHTTLRLAVTGAASRCDHVAIAPYHDGYVWGGQVDRTTTTFTPKFWSDAAGTFYYTVASSASTPTLTQRKAGSGGGILYGKSLAYTTVSGAFTTDTTATGFTNGVSYEHWIDFVDPDGYTWSVHQTIAAGAASSTDFTDTYANQNLRNALDFDRTDNTGVINQIAANKAIAVAADASITMINYEGGSHQNVSPPSVISTWFEAYKVSSAYASSLTHYYNCLAAAGCVVHIHYMDVSGRLDTVTPWRIAPSYTSTTDPRYVAVAAFSGLVPIRTLVESADVTGTAYTSAPAYPATVATFADATWTYSLATKGDVDDGNYSIAANVLSLTATGSINFATSAFQTVWIYATDGYTDDFFPVSFATGPATWYESADRFAWSAVDDTTPAVMNPSKGTAITPGTPATAVAGGWDMSGVANYQGGHGGTALAYTDSPLFAIVSRVDNDTSSFAVIGQYGNGGDFVTFTTFTGPARIAVDWNGATGAQHVGNTHAHSTSLQVHWGWVDNANLKVYTGVNLTEDVAGGTSFTSQGANTFTDFVKFGDARQVVIGGAKCGPAAGNLAAAKALIQKIMTKHGIP